VAASFDGFYSSLTEEQREAFYETDAWWFFGRTKLVRRAWVLFQRLQRGVSPRSQSLVPPDPVCRRAAQFEAGRIARLLAAHSA
jgi:hypothetical protein